MDIAIKHFGICYIRKYYTLGKKKYTASSQRVTAVNQYNPFVTI